MLVLSPDLNHQATAISVCNRQQSPWQHATKLALLWKGILGMTETVPAQAERNRRTFILQVF